jgi:bifunctional enzyme CysN/CysC
VDTPLEECIRRDPKGLYGKAHAGLIKNFTGLDSPYEAPTDPELQLDTLGNDAETLAAKVVDYLAASKL